MSAARGQKPEAEYLRQMWSEVGPDYAKQQKLRREAAVRQAYEDAARMVLHETPDGDWYYDDREALAEAIRKRADK